MHNIVSNDWLRNNCDEIRWRLPLTHGGIFLAQFILRLTSTRYADDALLCVKSLRELESVTEHLLDTLNRIGFIFERGEDNNSSIHCIRR